MSNKQFFLLFLGSLFVMQMFQKARNYNIVWTFCVGFSSFLFICSSEPLYSFGFMCLLSNSDNCWLQWWPPKNHGRGQGGPKDNGITVVLGFVPLFFLYRFYVYFAQLHVPSLLCLFRDEHVSQGLPGTAQGGPMSLIPILKYLRMSCTIMPHSFIE